jgi:hypothetical protein
MKVDVISDKRHPKMTPKLKKQLMNESMFFFCRKAGHLTKTCPW